MSVVQRFGGALNAHVDLDCCVTDRILATGEDEQVHFAESGALTPEDLAAVRHQVSARVLRWAEKPIEALTSESLRPL